MIETRNLGLEEITVSEYNELRAYVVDRPRIYYSPNDGYAQIVEPLVYSGFEELVVDASETPWVRKVSVRLSPHKWHKVDRRELDKEIIECLVREACTSGFIYIGFFGGGYKDHEIGFDFQSGNSRAVMSDNILLPGNMRLNYGWVGSSQEYYQIWGICTPQEMRVAVARNSSADYVAGSYLNSRHPRSPVLS